jgi:hypothetical protein
MHQKHIVLLINLYFTLLYFFSRRHFFTDIQYKKNFNYTKNRSFLHPSITYIVNKKESL